MKINNGRSALILAAGLFVCLAGPSQAAPTADTTTDSKSQDTAGKPLALAKNLRHGSHHWKSYAHRKSSRVALKPAANDKPVATDASADDSAALSAIPLSVANANAQLPSPDTPAGSARAMSARANGILQTDSPANARPDNMPGNDTQVVAADQLNDVDRALHESSPPVTNMVLALADPPAAPVVASPQESSTWDQTSLIGKIFIGFGALLTMASAARMFMA